MARNGGFMTEEDEAFEELAKRQGDWGLQGSRKHQILRYAENVESKKTSTTQEEIDILWQKAMQESIKDGDMFTRYHFAKLVAQAEREACVKACEHQPHWRACAAAIRARGQALAQPKQDGDCKKCKDGCPACDARRLPNDLL